MKVALPCVLNVLLLLGQLVASSATTAGVTAARPAPASTPTATVTSVEEVAVAEKVIEPDPVPVKEAGPAPATPEVPEAPAFVPPNFVQGAQTAAGKAEPPAFIPPEIARQRHG